MVCPLALCFVPGVSRDEIAFRPFSSKLAVGGLPLLSPLLLLLQPHQEKFGDRLREIL